MGYYFNYFWLGFEFISFNFSNFLSGFGGGSYPYVEYWDLNATENEVINAIKILRKSEPNLNPVNFKVEKYKRDTGYIWTSPEMIKFKELQKSDSSLPLPEKNFENYEYDYWLYFDFYNESSHETFLTWTRPTELNKTTFALIGIKTSDNQFKLINKDYNFIENKIKIIEFKQKIKNKIEKIIIENKNKN